MKPAADPPPKPLPATPRDPPHYQPLPRRRRLLLLGVAVATAMAVLWLMLQPQLRKMRADAERRPAPAAPCAPGQTQGCVGGTMGVISAPAPGASR